MAELRDAIAIVMSFISTWLMIGAAFAIVLCGIIPIIGSIYIRGGAKRHDAGAPQSVSTERANPPMRVLRDGPSIHHQEWRRGSVSHFPDGRR